jgi:hypothetical protein
MGKINGTFTPIPERWTDKWGWGTETMALGELLRSANYERITQTSIRTLQARWGWGKGRCSAFLTELVDQDVGSLQVHKRGHKRVHTKVDFSRLYGESKDTSEDTSEDTNPGLHIDEHAGAPVSPKDVEDKDKDLPSKTRANEYSTDFDDFWKRWNYPKKVTKYECFSWWKQNKPSDELQTLIIGQTIAENKVPGEDYILDPIRYLKRKRWEDEITDAHTRRSSTGNDRALSEGFARLASEARLDESEADNNGILGLTEPDIPF